MKKLLLAALMCLAFVGLRAQTLDPNYIDGHLYFKFVDSYDFQFRVNEDTEIDPSEMKQYANLFGEYGVTLITRPLYIFNDPFLERVIRLEFTQYKRINEFIAALEALPEIEYAERIPLPKLLYNDPYYSGSWGMSAGPYQWNLTMIDAEGAWAAQVASSDIKVAVVDGAVWGGHPDLQIASSNMCSYANGRASVGNSAPPESVSQTTNCSAYNFDHNNCPAYDWSHGTHCAGMVAAKNNNGIGISSIGGGDGTSGSGLTLMGVRAANDNDELNYTSNGVSWAINNGADVVSMSFGGPASSYSDRQMFQTAYNNGVVLVAAAGNYGNYAPTGYTVNQIVYPAGYSTVISVASVNYGGRLSTFSEYGEGRADIAAPGGFYSASESGYNNILSTTYCKNQYNRLNGNTALSGTNYDGMQGTSMACPTVAGLCGLMLSAYPQMTPAQVKNCLQSTANALTAGSHQIDGNGYINAANAVNCAKSLAGSLRANPSSITISSRGGSKTSTITASTSSSQGWTASCDNNVFTISPTSGSGNGAETVMSISAPANETDDTIRGTITITQGSETVYITLIQSNASDLCSNIGDDLSAHSDVDIYWTWYYYTNTYNFKYAQKIPNTKAGTVDSITFGGYYMYHNASTGAINGNITFNIYSNNNGVPGSVLASKTVPVTTLKSLANSSTENDTTYYLKYDYGLRFDTPVSVTGDFYIGIDMSSIQCTLGSEEIGFFDLASADEQVDYNYGLVNWSGSWYHIADLFDDADYYDLIAYAHFCESDDPYANTNPTNITALPITEEHEIEITSNCDWTISSDCDWAIVSPTSGVDNGTVTLTTVENGGDVRNCTVTITYEGGSSEITINQMAHQDGCDDALFYDIAHGGWTYNSTTREFELDTTIRYGYNIPYDDDDDIDSGYYYGTNTILHTSAAANLVDVYGSAVINSVTFLYGRTGTGGSVTFKIWDTTGTVLASKTVNMSALEFEEGYVNTYSWTLDEPLEVDASVYVGADFSAVTSGSFFYFYTNYWYASYFRDDCINNGMIQTNGTNWVPHRGTIGAFPSICYNGSHTKIDMAVYVMNADASDFISTMTLNPGETLDPVYIIGNWGEATYLDSTQIFITLDDDDYMTKGVEPLNFFSGGYLTRRDTIATMAELLDMGYRHNDVIDLCYRVAHTNDTYTWNDTNIANNISCVAVTINCPPVENAITETACDSYTFGTETYTIGGTYTDTLEAANGCDSIVTLNLTINHGTFNVETVSECTSYTWHGTEYTASGAPTYSYNNANGCASIDTLHLTIIGAPEITVTGNQNITPGNSTTLTASGADEYVWKTGGTTVSTDNPFTTPTLNNTTIYTVEGTTDGCTSSIEVTVTVQSAPTTYSETSAEACGSYTWVLNDNTAYTTSGDYTYTIAGGNSQGGDSTITLHLTINDNPTIEVTGETTIESGETTTLTASGAETYIWTTNGNNVSTDNPYTTPTLTSNTNYIVTGTDTNNCNGSTTVTIIVNSPNTVYDTVYRSACNSYEWNGQTLTASGDYLYAEGDNVHVLVLTINTNPTITVTGNISIYTGQTTTLTASGAENYVWTLSGNEVSTSNPFTTPALNVTTTYTVTGTDANTCSGSTQVTVTVGSAPASSGDTTAVACDSFTWGLSGETYNISGDYTARTSNANGGDSTVTLHLTINHSTTAVEEHVSCDSFTWHGTTYTESTNAPTFSSTNSDGCELVTTLHLTINYSTTAVEEHSSCDTYTWHGTTYTESTNNATYTTTGANGCPLVTTLHLTINHSTNTDVTEAACDNFTWSVNGQIYYTSGTYTYTTTDANDCNHTTTLHLTVNQSTTSTETHETCDVFSFNGTQYNQSGTYTVNRTNATGCPETVTLHLTVNPSTNDSIQQTACDSLNWDVNGQTYTTSGTYEDTGVNEWGCPNVATLILTINYSAVNNIYDTVATGQAYNNYGFNVSSAETGVAHPGDVIEREQNGFYTAAHCDSTIHLYLTVTDGHPTEGIDNANSTNLKVYPNPASSKVDINCESISAVRVYDMTGRMVEEQTGINSDSTQIDVNKLAEGVYVFSITTQNGDVLKQKVVVKH